MENNAARKLKQVPVGYLRVGVDPHKKRHVAVTMTEDFLVQGKFKFTNSRDGFEEALERARADMEKPVAWASSLPSRLPVIYGAILPISWMRRASPFA